MTEARRAAAAGAAQRRGGGAGRDGGPGRGRGPRRRADRPRRAAYDVLAAADAREAYANLLLPRLLADRGITGRDAALATELAYGTLRCQGTYDAVLGACSDRPLDKLDRPVLLVLRLGAHQLLATRVGGHAAVATSVDLAKDVAGPRASGYVNAVLRRVATRDLDQWLPIVAPPEDADPDGYLAVRYSYPRWIVGAYRDALGQSSPGGATPRTPRASPGGATPRTPGGLPDGKAGVPGGPPAAPDGPGPCSPELAAALAAGNERPRVTMAATPGVASRAEVMPDGAQPCRWSPYGFTLPGGDPAGLIAAGRAAVQDEASQLAAIALARAEVTAPGAGSAPLWLDMCAGPGGKARMLGGLAASRGARLVAGELHPHRARLVVAALGAAPGVVVADGRRPAWRDGRFERVLADVPCTGLGALRRRPEARWRKSPADLPALGELQRTLLRSAIAAARPGGVVAYVTCSPVPAETSEIIRDVAGGTPGVEALDVPALLPEVPDLRSAADPRFAQFWPHRHGTDAIFIALLRRL